VPFGSRRLAALAAGVLVVLALVPAAHAAKGMQVGIYDEAETLYGNPDGTFPLLRQLGVKVLRTNLYWDRVAIAAPADPANPADPAYDWSAYDRTAFYAQQFGIKLVLSIFGTPDWANGGKGARYAPDDMGALKAFASAAATRYAGSYQSPDGQLIPRVVRWMAWNEPNQPTFLFPQWVKGANGKYVPQSAITYAGICNAIVEGVHASGDAQGIKETVACGVTSPRGNNVGGGTRPSVSPLVFLRAMHDAGAKFDVYAHHPYPSSRFETPTSRPAGRTAVTLGNLDVLIRELDRLYGKRMRLWITEYGYQTNPPDKLFGVSYAKQARYLSEAFAIARKNPRVDMMLWFLLRDEPQVSGWQSGLFTSGGKQKPSFRAFRAIMRDR
jgi:hypothetical protein